MLEIQNVRKKKRETESKGERIQEERQNEKEGDNKMRVRERQNARESERENARARQRERKQGRMGERECVLRQRARETECVCAGTVVWRTSACKAALSKMLDQCTRSFLKSAQPVL